AEKLAAEKLAAERQAAEARRAQAELAARLEADQRRAAAISAGERTRYQAAIQARIESNWVRPASARPGLRCLIRVRQIPGGEVVDVSLGACNGDEAVRQSIVSAVLRASPLPVPSDPGLFERNLEVTFAPEE
ncbi:MAG: cell envelope integrity protein TolA, partial [Steroidobacteraceae bacterium]